MRKHDFSKNLQHFYNFTANVLYLNRLQADEEKANSTLDLLTKEMLKWDKQRWKLEMHKVPTNIMPEDRVKMFLRKQFPSYGWKRKRSWGGLPAKSRGKSKNFHHLLI